MRLLKSDINQLNKVDKLKLINGLTGAKPANLIGTQDRKGSTNLAIISSVVHLGTTPPLLGFFMRPNPEKNRHTYQNLLENPHFTINAVENSKAEKAHFTSFNFKKNQSEFDFCDLNIEYLNNFSAPFVQDSPIKIGLKLIETQEIKANNSVLIIGEVELIDTPQLEIDLEQLEIAAISGLNSYYGVYKLADYPYPTVDNIPKW